MIEKLDIKNGGVEDLLNCIKKINELVDVVNNQQIQLNNHECRLLDLQNRITALDDPTYHEAEPEPTDPYAEQRKWIGHLVEYGNADDGFKYGILTNIESVYTAYPFEIDNGRDATDDCWLPHDSIIFKGE